MKQHNSTLDAAASATKDEIFIDPSTINTLVNPTTALHDTHLIRFDLLVSVHSALCICAAAPKQVATFAMALAHQSTSCMPSIKKETTSLLITLIT